MSDSTDAARPGEDAGHRPALKVRFDMGPEDAVAFALHHARDSGQLNRARLALVVLTALIAGLSLLSQHAYWPLGVLFAAVLLGLGWFQLPRAMGRALRRQYAGGRNMAFFGTREVTLHPDHVRVLTPMSLSCFRWEMVEKVTRSDRLIMIYQGPMFATVIPVRAWRSEQEAEGFYREALARFERSRHTPVELGPAPWAVEPGGERGSDRA